MRARTGLLLLTACGRISFDAAHTADDAQTVDAPTADGFLRLDRVDPGEVLVDFPLPVRIQLLFGTALPTDTCGVPLTTPSM